MRLAAVSLLWCACYATTTEIRVADSSQVGFRAPQLASFVDRPDYGARPDCGAQHDCELTVERVDGELVERWRDQPQMRAVTLLFADGRVAPAGPHLRLTANRDGDVEIPLDTTAHYHRGYHLAVYAGDPLDPDPIVATTTLVTPAANLRSIDLHSDPSAGYFAGGLFGCAGTVALVVGAVLLAPSAYQRTGAIVLSLGFSLGLGAVPFFAARHRHRALALPRP
jgi:hypothetical protein